MHRYEQSIPVSRMLKFDGTTSWQELATLACDFAANIPPSDKHHFIYSANELIRRACFAPAWGLDLTQHPSSQSLSLSMPVACMQQNADSPCCIQHRYFRIYAVFQ